MYQCVRLSETNKKALNWKSFKTPCIFTVCLLTIMSCMFGLFRQFLSLRIYIYIYIYIYASINEEGLLTFRRLDSLLWSVRTSLDSQGQCVRLRHK